MCAIQHLGWLYNNYLNSQENYPLTLLWSFIQTRKFPFLLAITLNDLHRWKLPVIGEEKPGAAIMLFAIFKQEEKQLLANMRIYVGAIIPINTRPKRRAIDLAGASIGLGMVIQQYRFDISRQSYSRMGIVQVSLNVHPLTAIKLFWLMHLHP